MSVVNVVNVISVNLVTLTEYGFCLSDRAISKQFHQDQQGHIHGTNATVNRVMDITLAYNVSDWTAGYFGEIGGYIAYFSTLGQNSELRDIKTRVVLSGDQSTRVTLRSLHQNYLEPPLG